MHGGNRWEAAKECEGVHGAKLVSAAGSPGWALGEGMEQGGDRDLSRAVEELESHGRVR